MSISLEAAGLSRLDKVALFLQQNPVYCFEYETIKTVIEQMIQKGHRRLPILNKNKKLSGIVTIMDILSAFLREQNFNEPISTIMSREVIFSDVEETLSTVLVKFKFSRRGGFPILDDGKLMGLISERDIVRKFMKVNFGIRVKEVMTKKPFFVLPNISVYDALKSMVNTHYRRLPIVEGKKLVGIVTSTDLLSYLRDTGYNYSSLFVSISPTFNKEVYKIDKEKDLSKAIETMVYHDVGGLPVVDEENNLEGIITERDILEEIV